MVGASSIVAYPPRVGTGGGPNEYQCAETDGAERDGAPRLSAVLARQRGSAAIEAGHEDVRGGTQPGRCLFLRYPFQSGTYACRWSPRAADGGIGAVSRVI